MKYQLTKADGSARIEFSIDANEWAAALDKAFEQNKKKYSVPGFRKGHAPKSVVMRMYGEGAFYDDAFNNVFYDSYERVLTEEAGFEPVTRPDVSFDTLDEQGLKFSATVVVKPEVKLGAYRGVRLTHAEARVTSEDVDKEIASALNRAARKVAVTDRAAAVGDIANIDYSGSVDGVRFEGGSAEAQELELGSHTFIPGFEEQVAGMTIGETKEIAVKFPDDYHASELAGKDAVFTVKLNALTAKEVPAADDAFARDVSKFDTFAEYRADTEKRLTEAAFKRARDTDENNLLKAVVDASEVVIPDVMIEAQLDNLVKEFEYRLMYQGMKLADYYQYTNTAEADLRAARREEAETAVKTRLVMEAIVKAESIAVSDDELDAKIAELAKMSGKEPEAYRKEMTPQHLEYVRSDLVMDRLIKLVADAADWSGGAQESAARKAAVPAAKASAKKPAAKKAKPAEPQA